MKQNYQKMEEAPEIYPSYDINVNTEGLQCQNQERKNLPRTDRNTPPEYKSEVLVFEPISSFSS